MKRLKDLLLSTDFTMSIFVLIGLRCVVAGATMGDAVAIAAICGLQGFVKWNESYIAIKKQQPLNEKVELELQAMRAVVSGLAIKNSVRPSVGSDGEIKVPQRFF